MTADVEVESPARAIALALAAAAAALVVLGLLAGVSFGRISLLVAVSVAGATVVNIVGAAIGSKLRHRTLALQVAVVSTTAVAATAAGVLLSAATGVAAESEMHTLTLALVASATAALVEAFVLAVRVSSVYVALSGGGAVATASSQDPHELAHLDLTSWLAADLHRPVRAIAEVVRSLEGGAADDPVVAARHHAAIQHESERLIRLVDDLNVLGSGGSGRRTDAVSFSELVADGVAAVRGDAARAEVRLGALLEGGDAVVEAPLPTIARVIRVLLDDAIAHAPPGTLVEAESATDGDAAVLSVRDTCGGIGDVESARVFDVAFQSGDDDLVLAMEDGHEIASARRLVHQHDGELIVERLGDGCRCTVRLPLAR